MPNPPELFDNVAIRAGRQRAMKMGPALFLHEEAAFEIKERLKDINRTFTDPAVVTGFPGFWQAQFPTAKVIPDDDTLALQEGGHDFILHAMCLHQANDPVGQLIQCNRALRPDGLLLAVFFGGQTLNELRTAMTMAETRLSDGLSPRFLPMTDIRDAGALLQRAGFALPVADADIRRVSYSHPTALLHDLRAMGETNTLVARNRTMPPRQLLDEMAELYAKDGDRVVATYEMLYLTGWAPAENQPKPLRPGSAKARLADALKTIEMDETATPLPRASAKKESDGT